MSDTITFTKAEAHPKYGTLKVFVDSPYKAKDDINELEWDEYHHKWSSNVDWADDGYWLVDADKIHNFAEYMKNQGWEIESEVSLDVYTPETING